MVVRMLNTIHATLIDERVPSGVVSRMWTLAMQDLTQVGLVMSFVVIGWFLVSMALRALGLSAVAVTPKHKLASKLAQPVAEELADPVEEAAPSVDSCSQDVERARPGLELLEHYGVFGTAPGAWTEDSQEDLSEELEVPAADADADAAPLMPRRVMGSRTPRGLSLLEQYGVFGVSPKCWKEPSMNDFGDLLTAIT